MVVPSGHTMSVAMTNAGDLGWTTDRSGYQYTALDPYTGRLWPPMSETLFDLAQRAADRGGFPRLHSQCLSHQPLHGWSEAISPSGQERRGLLPSDRVSLARSSCDLPPRQTSSQRHTTTHSHRARRRPRLGRSGAAHLPRHCIHRSRLASANGAVPNQPHPSDGFATGAL